MQPGAGGGVCEGRPGSQPRTGIGLETVWGRDLPSSTAHLNVIHVGLFWGSVPGEDNATVVRDVKRTHRLVLFRQL